MITRALLAGGRGLPGAEVCAAELEWPSVLCRPVQDKDASTWEFSENLVPAMRAAADRSVRLDVAVEPGEEGPIPALHEGGLASHLGLSQLEIIQNAQITPSIARAQSASLCPACGHERQLTRCAQLWTVCTARLRRHRHPMRCC